MAYNIALFLHIVGALLLAAAFAVEWSCIRAFQNTHAVNEAKALLAPYAKLPAIGGIGTALILIPGIYMLFDEWGWAEWIIVSFVGYVIIGAIGGIVTGKKMRSLEKSFKQGDARLDIVQSLAADPAIAVSFWMRITLLLGIIYIMTAKPELVQSVIVLVVSILLGLIPLISRARTVVPETADEKLV